MALVRTGLPSKVERRRETPTKYNIEGESDCCASVMAAGPMNNIAGRGTAEMELPNHQDSSSERCSSLHRRSKPLGTVATA
jgi:hypothetical protein